MYHIQMLNIDLTIIRLSVSKVNLFNTVHSRCQRGKELYTHFCQIFHVKGADMVEHTANRQSLFGIANSALE